VEAKAVATSADLAAELSAIDKARSALTGGDASGALSQLDSYSRSYPRGRLALEAEVLRIDALARSGQREAARKRAELFVRRYPNSVLKARVRGYLDE
jgi:outer membrane protein assembly factor BamD (BamD/ComL family)